MNRACAISAAIPRLAFAGLLALLFPLPAAAQAPAPQYGCDSPESRQLDFWLGEWELAYAGGGKGRNRITKILGGCVILEEFSGSPGTKLDGRSYSTFDRSAKQWKQTWVDNTASYLDFNGGFEDGMMTFAREATIAGKTFRHRMVFSDVKTDSLKWLWQRSDDGGKSWKTTWEIDYKRLR